MKRYEARPYEPSYSEGSLDVALFDGGYGRTGVMWVQEDVTCTVCGNDGVCICSDGSDEEYSWGRICRACAEMCFEMFSSGMRGETEKVGSKRKQKWDENEAYSISNEMAYDKECEEHRNCQNPDCNSRVHPVIRNIGPLRMATELPRSSVVRDSLNEPIKRFKRDHTKVEWRSGIE